MEQKAIREALNLPADAPIPGAMYRRKQKNGHWEFATVIALEVLSDKRWVAVFASVRFGEERITSEHNNLRSYQLHSLPQASIANLGTPTLTAEALDSILSAEA